MYDRILELVTESSAARRAATRAQLARTAAIASNQGMAGRDTSVNRGSNIRKINQNVPVKSSSEIDRAISDKAQPKQATSPETIATQKGRFVRPVPSKGPARTSKTALPKAQKKAMVARGALGSKISPEQEAKLRDRLAARKKAGEPTSKPSGPAADSAAIPGNPLAQKQQASNIVRALQGGGTTLTKAVLGKITPFMRSGLKTSKVGPVL